MKNSGGLPRNWSDKTQLVARSLQLTGQRARRDVEGGITSDAVKRGEQGRLVLVLARGDHREERRVQPPRENRVNAQKVDAERDALAPAELGDLLDRAYRRRSVRLLKEKKTICNEKNGIGHHPPYRRMRAHLVETRGRFGATHARFGPTLGRHAVKHAFDSGRER
jgi:hypothetical protein